MSAGISERAKMEAGDWYCCVDPELDGMRQRAYEAVHEHNMLPPRQRGNVGPALAALLAAIGREVRIEAPFHCAYGVNIELADRVYLNAACTILDTARVVIGSSTMLGPGVQIYCAEHHKNAELRAAGLERGRPVFIGEKVWIGGGAIILPGVSIGSGAIVGAGAVVTGDVPEGVTVIGNPARTL
ncbi:MAG TPA: sugar O-acetyltransferase [Rhizobiaceae bacterium]|nr:sugar O-acetyltransferase [Rhizobiaceae bacterium]